MTRRAHFVFLFVIVSASLSAQHLTFNAGVGIGTYDMSDMKKFQSDIKQDFPGMTVTDEFPSYFYYQGSCQIALPLSFFTGLTFAYGSTGGRTQYHDYSGYVRADQVLQYFNLSASMGYRVAITERLVLNLDLLPTYTYTMANFRFEMDVADEYSLDEINLTSSSFALQPGLQLMLKLGKFGLHAQGSYYQTLVKGKMYSTEDQDAYLVGSDGKPYHAGWDGARLLVGVSVLIN